MMKLKQLAESYQLELKPVYGTDEVNAIFRIVSQHVLGFGSHPFFLNKNTEVTDENVLAFTSVLAKLKNNFPLQYILGFTEFYGQRFEVNQAVLIPRPETEELVKLILDTIANKKNHLKILDIGTGSGCIAITLKKKLPNATVYATDISEEALAVARKNADLNKVSVHFLKHDILNDGALNVKNFDVIVSNPPYIAENQKTAMHKNVLLYEPHSALFVSNENPLIFYKSIVDFAKNYLSKKGLLFFEINENSGAETMQIIKDNGFINSFLFKDIQRKNRMIKASRQPLSSGMKLIDNAS